MSEQTPQLRILLHQHQHQHRHHNQPAVQPSPPSPSSAPVETIYNVDDDTEPGQFLPDSPYSPVREHDNVYLSFQSDRKRVLDVFKEAIAKPLPSNAVALAAMQDAMKPQKQAVLVQDENQLLENGLRSLLQELVGTAVNAGEPVMHYGRLIDGTDDGRGLIMRLLDIVLYLCERGHVEGGMVFQLLEDLTEVSTIKDCKEVFGYIESKQELLGRSELFGRGKLVMLRTCNQLLRRLSKANDVVFCGRILMFLAHFFPLSERSAVNIKGVFNTSNETKYEKEPALDCLPIDINFYKTFWSLQEHFSSPAYLIQPARWQSFSSSLAVVLSAFEAQPLGEEDGSSTQGDDTSFNIKYLTSSNLLSLELKDPSFRRHVLVQCLIVFDYLKKEEATLLEERVKRLLEATPPKGKEFLGSIEHILKRERNWVWWKKDACPAFERAPEPKPSQEGGKKRKQRWRLGNKELSQLWKWADQNPNALTDTHRLKLPTVMEYWKPLAEDMDPSAGIEPDYHHKNNRVYCWKGLRLSARQDLEGFSKFTDLGFEGVVPPELLPQEVRHKIHGKASEKSKHKVAKKDDGGASAPPPEDSQANSGVTMLDDATNVQEEDGALLDSDAQLATKMGNEDGQDPDVDPDNDMAADMASPEENSPDRGASFENGSPPTDMVSMEIESHGILPQSSPRLPESNVRKHS